MSRPNNKLHLRTTFLSTPDYLFFLLVILLQFLTNIVIRHTPLRSNKPQTPRTDCRLETRIKTPLDTTHNVTMETDKPKTKLGCLRIRFNWYKILHVSTHINVLKCPRYSRLSPANKRQSRRFYKCETS